MAPVICELPYLHHINAGAFRYIVHDYILNLPTHNWWLTTGSVSSGGNVYDLDAYSRDALIYLEQKTFIHIQDFVQSLGRNAGIVP